MSNGPGGAPNSKTNAIASILTSTNADTWVKMGTLALVVASGGGNLFATKQAERSTDQEVRKAVDEIHQIYRQLDDTIDRQKEMLGTLKRIDEQTKREQH